MYSKSPSTPSAWTNASQKVVSRKHCACMHREISKALLGKVPAFESFLDGFLDRHRPSPSPFPLFILRPALQRCETWQGSPEPGGHRGPAEDGKAAAVSTFHRILWWHVGDPRRRPLSHGQCLSYAPPPCTVPGTGGPLF